MKFNNITTFICLIPCISCANIDESDRNKPFKTVEPVNSFSQKLKVASDNDLMYNNDDNDDSSKSEMIHDEYLRDDAKKIPKDEHESVVIKNNKKPKFNSKLTKNSSPKKVKNNDLKIASNFHGVSSNVVKNKSKNSNHILKSLSNAISTLFIPFPLLKRGDETMIFDYTTGTTVKNRNKLAVAKFRFNKTRKMQRREVNNIKSVPSYDEVIHASNDLSKIQQKIGATSEDVLIRHPYIKLELSKQLDDLMVNQSKTMDALKKADGTKKNELIEWLENQYNKGKLLQQELETLKSLGSIITQLEAAKYLAKNRVTQAIDGDASNNPYYGLNNNDNYINTMENFGDTTNPFYQITLPDYNGLSNLGGKNINYDHIYNNYANNNYNNDEMKNYYNYQNINKGLWDEKENAITAMDKLQTSMGLDSQSIGKLITSVKRMAIDEIDIADSLIKKDEKLISIAKRNSIVHKPSSNELKEILEHKKLHELQLINSKERLEDIKNMEQLATRIEAIKYLARLKQTGYDFKQLLKQ